MTSSSLAAALARARSPEVPGPDFPAGRQVSAWPGPCVAVPPPLDRLLRCSLAGGRLRPAASAGGLHPVNAHLLVGPGPWGLPPGRYAYDPVGHRLRLRGAVDGDVPPGALAVLTVTARRTVSHYGHRAWPLLLLDAGHAVAALALAGAVSWSPDTDGALLAAAAGLPAGRGEPEHPLVAVRLGLEPPGGASALHRWAAHPSTPPPPPGPHPAPPVLREAWRALGALAAADGTPTWLPTSAAPPLDDATLTARRSATPPFPGVPEQGQIEDLLDLARAATAHAEGLRWTPVVPGRRLPGLAARAAGQAWPAATGAVLLAHGCPDDAEPARVRRDHLAAGYAVGLAQAAATALGLASRPVGSWQHGPEGPPAVVHALALGLPAGAAGPADAIAPPTGPEPAELPEAPRSPDAAPAAQAPRPLDAAPEGTEPR